MLAFLAALLFGSQPKIPKPPVAPDVQDATGALDESRSRRRRLLEGGRGSTFLSGQGGPADLGQTRRGSDVLNPFGAAK